RSFLSPPALQVQYCGSESGHPLVLGVRSRSTTAEPVRRPPAPLSQRPGSSHSALSQHHSLTASLRSHCKEPARARNPAWTSLLRPAPAPVVLCIAPRHAGNPTRAPAPARHPSSPSRPAANSALAHPRLFAEESSSRIPMT